MQPSFMRIKSFKRILAPSLLALFLLFCQHAWADSDRPIVYEWTRFDSNWNELITSGWVFTSPDIDLSGVNHPHLYVDCNPDYFEAYYSTDGVDFVKLEKTVTSTNRIVFGGIWSIPKEAKSIKVDFSNSSSYSALTQVVIGDWRDATDDDVAISYCPDINFWNGENFINGWEYQKEGDYYTLISPELDLRNCTRPALLSERSIFYNRSEIWYSYDGITFEKTKINGGRCQLLPLNVKRVKICSDFGPGTIFIAEIGRISVEEKMSFENPVLYQGEWANDSHKSCSSQGIVELTMDFPNDFCGDVCARSKLSYLFDSNKFGLCKVNGEWLDLTDLKLQTENETYQYYIPLPAGAEKWYIRTSKTYSLPYDNYLTNLASETDSGMSASSFNSDLAYDYDGDKHIEMFNYGWHKASSSNTLEAVKSLYYQCGQASQTVDLDGDGYVDVISDKVYFSDSYGDMHVAEDISSDGWTAVDVANDGKLQLLDISNTDVPTQSISFNDGRTPVKHHVNIMSANAFRKTGKPAPCGIPSLKDGMFVGGPSSSVKFTEFANADLTGDGIPDIYSPETGNVYAGIGDGTFIELVMSGNMKLRDLDGDGVSDFVTFDEGSKTLAMHFVSADGNITSKQLLNGLYCNTEIWLYDFDKDGDVDILVPFDYTVSTPNTGHANGASYLVMFENKGNRTFKKHEHYIGEGYYFTKCVDTDADGNYEVLAYDGGEYGRYTNGTYLFNLNGIDVDTTPLLINGNNNIKTFADLTNSGIIHAIGKYIYPPCEYTALSDKVNQRPTMPDVAPTVSYNKSEQLLTVTWSRGSDVESSPLDLTYEVRVSSSLGKNDIVHSDSHPDGTRRNLHEGREGYSTTRIFNVATWKPGTYYIDVQAIDPNCRGSEFCPAVVWTKEGVPASFELEYVNPFGIGDICRVVTAYKPENGISYVWDTDDATIISASEDKSELLLSFSNFGEKRIGLRVTDAEGNQLNSLEHSLYVKRSNLKRYPALDKNASLSADFNADGKNELIVFTCKMYHENASGEWEELKKIYNTNMPYIAYLLDVNRDGLPDAIAERAMLINQGDMDMEIETDRSSIKVYGDAVSDFDNDGVPEVLDGGYIYKYNNAFTSTYKSDAGDTGFLYTVLSIQDLNGDGLRDFIYDYSNNIRTVINQGDNTFKEDESFNIEDLLSTKIPGDYSHSPFWEAVGDFDNDGKPDYVISDWVQELGQYQFAIIWNDGTITPLISRLARAKVAIQDFDNNGFEDIMITGETGEIYIYHMLPGRKFDEEPRNALDDETDLVKYFKAPRFLNSEGDLIAYDNYYYLSKLIVDNERPDAPTDIVVNETEQGVVIDWTHAVDKETPGVRMRYNISIRRKGVEGEGAYFISPMNGEVDYAPVPQGEDNIEQNDILWRGTRFLIPREVIANGDYIVRIQAFDAIMAASAFSDPVEFTVKGGTLGKYPSVVKVGDIAEITLSASAGNTIDWQGGVVKSVNGSTYQVAWNETGIKRITDGKLTASINVVEGVDASFSGVPDEVVVGDIGYVVCPTYAEGEWMVSFNGTTFNPIADFDNYFNLEIADASAQKPVKFYFGRCGDVYVRHTVATVYGQEVFTKKYTVKEADLLPDIDMVNIDSETGRLRVTFKQETRPEVLGFNLYRETSQTAIYDLVATGLGVNDSFVDNFSEPTSRSSRYCVSWILPYGESRMSVAHQSVHLMINRALGNAINLMWSPYEGREIDSYTIYRGATAETMQPIATVSGNARSYTDMQADSTQPLYAVAVIFSNRARANGEPVLSNVVSTADAMNATLATSVSVISEGNSTEIGGPDQKGVQLNAVIEPITAGIRYVNWTIEEGADIATVSSTGYVTMYPDAPMGSVVVRATAVDGSGAYGEITLNAISSVEDAISNILTRGELICSPTVVDSEMTVNGLGEDGTSRLYIYNISGVVCRVLDVEGSSAVVSVDGLAAGHYFVRAENRLGISIGRFVKK